MEQCITIVSACNLYWRRHHLSADCIAVEPAGGWHGTRNNQSLKALKWLKWVEHTLREEERDSGLPARTEDRVTHAGNREEHAIVTPTRVCYVDSFDPVIQTVYEFHGCVWHGCPRCNPNCRLVLRVHLDRFMEEVYDATCAKTALLRSMGFTVVEMWECFWDDLSKHDPRLIQFLHTLEIVEPLDPRHAFYGGRTGATCLYDKTDEAQGEKVHYIDVTSEYLCYGTYPVGHPQILMSPQTTDLSTGYVDTCLKMKQESSGQPSHVHTPEELQNYIDHYKAHEGIRMEPVKIVKNAARHSLAKLMLNLFWSKFGEQLNKSAVESVTVPHELFEYLNNSLMVIHAIGIFSEDVLEVVFSYADEDASKGKRINIFIAAFTTTQAHLKLYSYLDPLRDQVL